jgi:hypothetical protein
MLGGIAAFWKKYWNVSILRYLTPYKGKLKYK